MPEWLIQMPSVAAVIFVVILFLKELRALGCSRDEERANFLASLEDIQKNRDEERKAFTDAIISLVSLAQKMVDKCQLDVTRELRVTDQDVLKAGRLKAHQ